MNIMTALQKAEAWLDEVEGVEGIAQGESDGEECITVFVSTQEAKEKLPEKFHGYTVVIEAAGQFEARQPR